MSAGPLHKSPERKSLAVLLAAAVVVVTAVAFAPVRDFGFVNWDDDVYVTDNPLVQEPLLDAASGILTRFVSGNYHPLTIASYALDRALFGTSPRAFHLLNLSLHLVNVVLVLRLLTALGTPPAAAALAALLWAVHPLRVEPVAWVSGRKDLLATLCSLGSILAYLRFRQSGRPRAAAGSILCFMLALLSKATAVAVPGLLLAVDWLQGRRITLAVIREKVPYLALAAVFSALAVLARHSYQGVLEEQAFGWQHLLFQGAFRGAFTFLLRSVVPIGNPSWLYPDASFPLLLSGHFAAAAGFLAAVAAGALLSLRRTRKVAFGLLFFLVALAPALPVSVLGYSADRFTYLPAVGIAYLLGELIGRWQGSASARRPAGRLAAVAAIGAVVLLLLMQTRSRSGAWADSETLWSTAIREYRADGRAGANLARAYTYRARSRLAAGRSAEARGDYAEAARLDPQSVELRNERGIALAGAAAHREAIDEFTAALALAPTSSAAAFNRGVSRLALGEAARAADDFSRALQADPSNSAALLGRARARLLLEDLPGAARDAEALLRRHPDHPEALDILALRRPRGAGAPPP